LRKKHGAKVKYLVGSTLSEVPRRASRHKNCGIDGWVGDGSVLRRKLGIVMDYRRMFEFDKKMHGLLFVIFGWICIMTYNFFLAKYNRYSDLGIIDA
jgi:hypothetical protein